jgi:uncharacterized protein (TIGR03083 family)
MMTTRAELLQTIERERAAWRALLAEIGEERMQEPGPMGAWTFKDLTAHLLAWDERLLARIEAGPDGTPAPAPRPASLEGDDAINAWIQAHYRDRPLRDVLADMDGSYARLAALIEAMPEDQLLTPGRFDFMEGRALVEGAFFGHLHEEHEPAIRAWLQTVSTR